MSSAPREGNDVTFLKLEFGTDHQGATPLGDVALSLVSVDELLRDLAAIAAHPSRAEFRNIEVVAIESRSPLTITLSLLAISAEAVTAFQGICRDIIRQRDRSAGHATPAASEDDVNVKRLDAVKRALTIRTFAEDGDDSSLTEREADRLRRHMMILQNAAVPLKRVELQDGAAGFKT